VNYLRVVTRNKRNWIGTLKPNGMKSGYSGLTDIIENGLLISGLWMAPKAPIIIHDMELGKPYLLPECPGNDLARGNDSLEGRGNGKKRMAFCNGMHRGSKFALSRKGADLP